VAVDYTGTFLYSANKSSNDLSAFTLMNGTLSAFSTIPTGSGPISVALVRPRTNPLFTATAGSPNTDYGSTTSVIAAGVNDLGQVAGTAVFLFPMARRISPRRFSMPGVFRQALPSADPALGMP